MSFSCSGRLIGEFLQDEISGPLNAEVYIGVPESKLERCTDLKAWGIGKVLAQSFIPSSMGRKIEPNFKDFLKVIFNFGRTVRIFLGGLWFEPKLRHLLQSKDV